VETTPLPGFAVAKDHSSLGVLVSFPSKNQSLFINRSSWLLLLRKKA
jgi:hypothetical protein